MKMPEPIATVTDNFATDYSEISRTWQRPIPLGTKLYDKQALIDLLEEAAKECEKEYDNWDNERPLRIAATAIRKLKETL
jgi:hypothetical protein